MNILSTSFLMNGLTLQLVSGINLGRGWTAGKPGQASEKARVGSDDVSVLSIQSALLGKFLEF